jgi:LPXTG-motif cell wall-anchored protein
MPVILAAVIVLTGGLIGFLLFRRKKRSDQ